MHAPFPQHIDKGIHAFRASLVGDFSPSLGSEVTDKNSWQIICVLELLPLKCCYKITVAQPLANGGEQN